MAELLDYITIKNILKISPSIMCFLKEEHITTYDIYRLPGPSNSELIGLGWKLVIGIIFFFNCEIHIKKGTNIHTTVHNINTYVTITQDENNKW